MPPGQRVLALEEEGAGKLQADADQLGPPDQHGAQNDDGLVQQRVPPLLVDAALLRRPDRGQADVEQHAGAHRAAPGQRPEHDQRLVELARPDQRLRLL